MSESLREKVAQAMFERGERAVLGDDALPWKEVPDAEQDIWRSMADAVLAVVLDNLPDQASLLKAAYGVRPAPVDAEDAWAFGEGARCGIGAALHAVEARLRDE